MLEKLPGEVDNDSRLNIYKPFHNTSILKVDNNFEIFENNAEPQQSDGTIINIEINSEIEKQDDKSIPLNDVLSNSKIMHSIPLTMQEKHDIFQNIDKTVKGLIGFRSPLFKTRTKMFVLNRIHNDMDQIFSN